MKGFANGMGVEVKIIAKIRLLYFDNNSDYYSIGSLNFHVIRPDEVKMS